MLHREEDAMTQGPTRLGLLLSLIVIAVTPCTESAWLQKETLMIARGTFEVKMTPPGTDDSQGGSLVRFFLNKKFEGDLQGTSRGQMLTSGSPSSSYAAYAALEHVTGALDGRRGSFILLHRGTMGTGGEHLDVTVVPGSGTDELAGISGAMTIVADRATHTYELSYGLPPK